MLVVVASAEDAAALAPLRAVDEVARPTLVATGPDPMAVDLALDDLEVPAGRVLLPEGPVEGPAEEVGWLLPRFAAALSDGGPDEIAAVVVRGGSAAAVAAVHAAVWAGVPVLALDAPVRTAVEGANRAAIAGLAAWQTSEAGATAYPARLDLVVHRHLEAARGHRLVCIAATESTRTGLSA